MKFVVMKNIKEFCEMKKRIKYFENMRIVDWLKK